MVPHIIPGHITALYVFACINLMALFHITLVEADITVLNNRNGTAAQYLDLPAAFGPAFPEEGLYGRVLFSPNFVGHCRKIDPPPPDPNIKYIALLQRNGCHFDVMVYTAQEAGYIAVVVFNNDSNSLLPMGGGEVADKVIIPSCFVSESDGINLQKLSRDVRRFIIIDGRVPFNYNLYLLPFAIVVGICFLLMLIFMIAKWVRDLRRRRRARLSREHLKKLPTKKFKKGDPYDICAICLDEYEEGEKLRILPCSHAYHMKCVDPWLTKNKRNCPVCKRKVIPGDDEDSDSELDSDDEHDAPSETTPLLTAQNASQLGANNSAFQSSGAVSDANSVHAEDIHTEEDDSDQEFSTPSTSAAQVLAPAPNSRSRGGYGSLTRSPNHHQQHADQDDDMNSNPEYRGAVGGVGVYIPEDSEDDDRGRQRESELRGIVSSDADEEDEADQNTSLRVKIISLFKSRRQNRRQRREDSDEDA